MAKPFDTKEVKRMIAEQRGILEALQGILNASFRDRQEIRNAVESVVTEEVVKILRDIPLEEINRDKNGIRVKALRDSGYGNIADLAFEPVQALAAVRGISEETAFSIKEIVDGILAKARQGIKIRVSADNKSPEISRLVMAVYKYKAGKPLADACGELLNRHKNTILTGIEDLEKVSGTFKWLFASKAERLRAMNAYNTLGISRFGEFGRAAESYIRQWSSVKYTDDAVAWEDFSASPIPFFNILENIAPGVLGNSDTIYGLPEELALEIRDECLFPNGLLCELRRYQEWGVKYILHQENVLLGDEMGLGKTVQAIAAMVSLKNTGATHFVVVCPASVLSNWCREVQKMSRLRTVKIHGNGRRSAFLDWMKHGGVAITTYETTAFLTLPEDFHYSMLVADEAHYIKNPSANRTENVKRLGKQADRLLFMTGTALENRVDEMVSLIGILQPEIARKIRGIESLSAAPQFRKLIAPVYYRRKREDVLTELPECIENKEWCTLNKKEERVYESAVLSGNYALARRVSWNMEDIRDSTKAARLLELVDEAESDGRKVLVFSFFLDTIHKVTDLLGNRCIGPITGAVPPQKRQQIIDAFDRAPAGTVLAAQIQSGGTGLNIQSASVVIICEPQFKPSAENQAISRAYRMGQARNVLVYRLLCENTVDEKVITMLESKQTVFDAFADKSEAAQRSMELDDRTFGDMIKEEIERINEKNRKEQSTEYKVNEEEYYV